ncbi:MAG: OmpA family protein [Pseudomonadota bacterium]
MVRHILLIILGCGMFAAGTPAAAQSVAAQQVCADIMAQYGIAPEGCDPEQDARREAVAAANAPAPVPAAQEMTADLESSNVFFPAGGDGLDAAARARLDLLRQVLNTDLMRDACLRLVGHSDASGPASANQALALARAQKVAGFLRAGLNDPSRIEAVVSAGESDPLPSYAAENAKNRRVTIWARTCPEP